MTKEQEVIKYIETRIKICNENADICDDNDFDEEATYLREESYMLETALNMLKEKDKKIESLEKTLDKRFIYVTGARTVYGRLMQLDKESIVQDDLKRRNELNQCIKAEEKYKELYHKALGDLAKADRENIKKDKQIDLMAKAMDKIQDPQVCKYCDNINLKHGYCVDAGKCKEGIKQYFEKLAKEKKII